MSLGLPTAVLACLACLLPIYAVARPTVGPASPPNPMTKGKQIPGPSNASDAAVLRQWHSDMQRWRSEYRASTNYNGKVYSDPQLKWTQTSYMQPQMHPCERVHCSLSPSLSLPLTAVVQ